MLFSIYKPKRRESAVQTWSEIGSSLRMEPVAPHASGFGSSCVSLQSRIQSPRSEVERLVHKVFVEIMSGSREAANLGL